MSRRRIDRYLHSAGYVLIRANGHRVYRNVRGQTIVVSNTPHCPSRLFFHVRADVLRNKRA
jgi:predicted RNA binding protein YcfA (HicA-like mRNA interferase family)